MPEQLAKPRNYRRVDHCGNCALLKREEYPQRGRYPVKVTFYSCELPGGPQDMRHNDTIANICDGHEWDDDDDDQ